LARELPSQPGRSVVAGLWVPPTSDQLISAATVVSCRTAADHAGAVPVDATVAASSFFSSSSCSSSSSSSCSSTFNDHAVVDSVNSSGKSLDNAHSLGNAETERGEICCDWCQVCFPSTVDLEVHMHTDHILMRDGRDYRCTLANCDKIYPNMDCLRQHVKLHFVAGGEQLAATMADLTTDYPRRHYHHQQQQQQPTAIASVL
ncbi:hypothetical protein T4E_2281, partial [Trichinella pseudospiralis]